ncbi:MAG: hypothetical protein E5X53_28250 [Mesorhizobium sp.]|uniref:hypothetical protein n=1 Tax=Mesorhizobium sp. TaxID=1871066 RepID=UPI0011FCB2E6|nr:hypothetical protein [Mesorhizobium sp.]TIP70344.1 MAG: hypothetical protein E5X55_27900 [Mesorhizobium sp.]TIQ06741.1 MAG: hypothetical protein E5X57_24120 [Mesorhizobium sp.]TIR48618.1 MAG: hypothetical protein E5X53_28250 [Mesorhizobium sp.]TJV94693.1 MAG: hypothetical protein E5X52_27885 [Mesorhizobium sp.]
MIDLAQIIEKIETRIAELGTTAAEVSAKATDSKDTIRNWKRAVDADRENGTNKASATTIKLNQVEAALGIELARNSTATPIAQLQSALLAYGVDHEDLRAVMKAISGFLPPADELPQSDQPRDQFEPASRRREVEPSR